MQAYLINGRLSVPVVRGQAFPAFSILQCTYTTVYILAKPYTQNELETLSKMTFLTLQNTSAAHFAVGGRGRVGKY